MYKRSYIKHISVFHQPQLPAHVTPHRHLLARSLLGLFLLLHRLQQHAGIKEAICDQISKPP